MHTRINEIVRKSGLTKTDFAKRLNVSQPFLSQLCAGVKSPSDRTIADICREFGCNEVWLRTGEGEPFREESESEQIMRFAVQAARGSNKFQRALAAMFADMTEEDWANLEKLYDKFAEKYK